MSLVHISDYLNEFKVEMNNYEQELTRKAEEVSEDIKKIQHSLANLSVEPFSYQWEEDIREECYGTLSLRLAWSGSKVMLILNDDSEEAALGANRQIRASLGEHLENFLSEGLRSIQRKTSELA